MTNTEFTGIVLSAAMTVFPDKRISKTQEGYFVDGVNVGDVKASEMFLKVWDKDKAREFAKDYFAARLPLLH